MLTPGVLRLPYDEWVSWLREHRDGLNVDQLLWLAAWSKWDLACSPMDDEHRRQIRYGHYLGFVHANENHEPLETR